MSAQRKRRPARTDFDVRPGDEWVYDTNTGGLSRTIVAIDNEYVEYREFGSPYTRLCKRKTFRRWWRGARLNYCAPDKEAQP